MDVGINCAVYYYNKLLWYKRSKTIRNVVVLKFDPFIRQCKNYV